MFSLFSIFWPYFCLFIFHKENVHVENCHQKSSVFFFFKLKRHLSIMEIMRSQPQSPVKQEVFLRAATKQKWPQHLTGRKLEQQFDPQKKQLYYYTSFYVAKQAPSQWWRGNCCSCNCWWKVACMMHIHFGLRPESSALELCKFPHKQAQNDVYPFASSALFEIRWEGPIIASTHCD